MRPMWFVGCKKGSGVLQAFLLAILCLSFVVCVIPSDAQNGKFPGKGSYQDWQRANQLYNAGNHLSDSNSYKQAIEKYQEAIQIYSYDPDYFENQGLAYKKDGQLELAIQAYKKSIDLYPGNWTVWKALANPLYRLGRYKEARQATKKSLECNPPADQKAEILQGLAKLDKTIQEASRVQNNR